MLRIPLGVGVGILGGMNANIGFRPDFVGDNFFERHIGFRVDFNSWEPLQHQADSYFERHPIELDGNDFRRFVGLPHASVLRLSLMYHHHRHSLG